MAQIGLQRTRVAALVGELKAAGVAQLVRVNVVEASDLTGPPHHLEKTARAERRAALAYKHKGV
jgi:hypothetical protein